jgi:hypothetical protein
MLGHLKGLTSLIRRRECGSIHYSAETCPSARESSTALRPPKQKECLVEQSYEHNIEVYAALIRE